MTEILHELTVADRAAMASLRAALSAHPAAPTRASFDQLFERVPAPESVDYSESSVGGVPGVWCTPASSRPDAAILYVHGGVFCFGSARAFRHLVGHIAARSGVRAFVADYRLAPEHPFPAALDDAQAAHRGLAAQVGAERLAVVGDSAGGGLALSLLQDGPGARCGVLISPWTDLALTGGSIESKAGEDPILSRAALEAGARQYLGEGDRRDPRVSPIFAPARRGSRIQVHVGTAEVLLDDALRLDGREGVELHVWEGMPHGFPSNIGLFEAARHAQQLIGSFIRGQLR
jgi:monoterpene epsilon-lactone hydrolase